jgi:leucine-rich repeat protein SHOC2
MEVNQNKLTQLPSSLSRLVNLRTLNLTDNQLERLPDDIGKLRKLQILSLTNNQLTALPTSIGQLDSLSKLIIGKNKLRVLPGSITRLSNLTTLSIGANELTALPTDIGALRQLTELRLGPLPIDELPASISDLQNLRVLQITSTRLRLLPENIGALTKLQYVHLIDNELMALPNSISGWKEVAILSLDGNKLEGLPNTIGQLTKLTTLTIRGKEDAAGGVGGLHQLPDGIVNCTQLWSLSIQHQPELDADDVFAKAARLKSLTHLSVSNCNVSQIPSIDWKNVSWQILDLANNLLTELPVSMLDAPVLQSISVFNNRLPDMLNRHFFGKEDLRVAFVETGVLPLESLPKPSRKVSGAYQQMASQKVYKRDWEGAFIDMGKAIDYAPDTIRTFVYLQLAGMHFSQKDYTKALADYDQALQYAPQLRKEKTPDTLMASRMAVTCWQQKAAILGTMGQYESALKAILQAERLLPALDNTMQHGLMYTDHGRYLTMTNKLIDADSSYRKAIRAYEKLPYADPAIRLTIVELSLLTGQYDRAQQALANLPASDIEVGRFMGYSVLKEYLQTCLAVLKNQLSGAQASERLTTYLNKYPTQIYGWSFDLFDNWLAKSKLPADKVTALRQLTDSAKERLDKRQ